MYQSTLSENGGWWLIELADLICLGLIYCVCFVVVFSFEWKQVCLFIDKIYESKGEIKTILVALQLFSLKKKIQVV